jgi:hypothetical protein
MEKMRQLRGQVYKRLHVMCMIIKHGEKVKRAAQHDWCFCFHLGFIQAFRIYSVCILYICIYVC